MAYQKNVWQDRVGVGLNRFVDQNGNEYEFTPAPVSVTSEGTPFSAAWMNHIEEGIETASDALEYYHSYMHLNNMDLLEFAAEAQNGLTVIGLGIGVTGVPTFGGTFWNYCTGYILRRNDNTFIVLFGRNSMTATNHLTHGVGWVGWRCLVDSPNSILQVDRGGTGGLTNLLDNLSFQNGWGRDGMGTVLKLGKAVYFNLPIRNGLTAVGTTILTGMPATNGSTYWYRCTGLNGGAVVLQPSGELKVHEAMSVASVTVDGIYLAADE